MNSGTSGLVGWAYSAKIRLAWPTVHILVLHKEINQESHPFFIPFDYPSHSI